MITRNSKGIFDTWQELLTAKCIKAGLPRTQAADFATTLIAATEGAVVMARSAKDIAPFERVASQLVEQAKRLS